MSPVAWEAPGGFELRWYGVMMALGIFGPTWLAGRLGRRRGLPAETGVDLALLCVFVGIGGARLEHLRTNWPGWAAAGPAWFDLRSGGQVFYGGLLATVLGTTIYAWRRKIDGWDLLDVASATLPFGLALGRVGCFFAGCCYGRPTELPWGIVYSDPRSVGPLGVALHPTQLYEAIYAALLGGFLVWRWSARWFRGEVFLWFFTLYPPWRIINEAFRADPDRGWFLQPWLGDRLTTAQGTGLVLLLLVIPGWWWMSRRDPASVGSPPPVRP